MAAKCGWDTLMTDKNEEILNRLKESANLNQVTISTRVLRWGTFLESSDYFDLLLLSDCFYDTSGKYQDTK